MQKNPLKSESNTPLLATSQATVTFDFNKSCVGVIKICKRLAAPITVVVIRADPIQSNLIVLDMVCLIFCNLLSI